MILEDSIEKLKGIGPKKAQKFKKIGIKTIKDLILVFPKRYINLASIKKIKDLKIGRKQSIFGKITSLNVFRTPHKRVFILNGIISDETGSLNFQFFNQPYLLKKLKDKKVFFYGKPIYKEGKILLSNPHYEFLPSFKKGFLSIYPEIGGFSSKEIRFLINKILSEVKTFPTFLPSSICKKYNLFSFEYALKILHNPRNLDVLKKAKRTWAIYELLKFALNRKVFLGKISHKKGYPCKIFNLKKYIDSLPFRLTSDQRKALFEILKDLSSPFSTTRLLNGDVGSGKTIVAFLAMINVVLSGKKTVLMAPTEILAYQHFLNFQKFFNKFKFKTLLLTKIWKIKSEGEEKSNLKSQDINKEINKNQIVFGTHTLLEEKIKIKNLGFVVIDEQQRFGVKQRAILRRKDSGDLLPHLLMLTATPIPRTLAFVIFKDLPISFLKNAPFLKNVKTRVVTEKKRKNVYKKIKEELNKGNQAFVICPIIEKKDLGLVFDDRKAAEEEFLKIKEEFRDYSVGLLHGRMKAKEKEEVIRKFREEKIKILVSTSVIEVGVDIPKANVLLVETAERFGLSQLHQLRGRIGRKGQKAFCFLMASKSRASKLKILEKTQDGFLISQFDLKERGPGEILGEAQHGFLKFRFADLFNERLLKEAQAILSEIENFSFKSK